MRNRFVLIILSFMLVGCTPAPMRITTTPLPKPYLKGIYHRVLRGQTLWRIAKAYRVDIEDIIETNHIAQPSKIGTGQMIFIPGVKEAIRGNLSVHIPKRSERNYVWPVKGRIASYYNSKRDNVANKGIDIEAGDGEIVVAARSGKVVFCDDKVKGLGRAIIIEHHDGYSTLYAHNSAHLVECGDYVKQNQPIALVGSTGRADKPTLHFQIRKGHKPRNPFYYLP